MHVPIHMQYHLWCLIRFGRGHVVVNTIYVVLQTVQISEVCSAAHSTLNFKRIIELSSSK